MQSSGADGDAFEILQDAERAWTIECDVEEAA
jgi:hypothetical protein